MNINVLREKGSGAPLGKQHSTYRKGAEPENCAIPWGYIEKSLQNIRVVYTIGEYNTREDAKKELDLVQTRGFKDAIVIQR